MKPQLPIVTPEFIYQVMRLDLQRCKTPKNQMPAKKSDHVLIQSDHIGGDSEPRVKIDRRREGKLKIDPAGIPIMPAATQKAIESTIAMFHDQRKWKDWGLRSLREGGPVVLFEGPPGTGKTTIALYMSKLVGRGFTSISMADVGGKAPGDSERNLIECFEDAKRKGWMTIFLDECDTILVSRDKIGADSHYLTSIVNTLLQRCTTYQGLIVMATNRPQVLDPALASRLLAKIHIGRPALPERIRLWRQKIPRNFPFQPTQVQVETLAGLDLSGREIENAIIDCACHCINADELPSFATLQLSAQKFIGI